MPLLCSYCHKEITEAPIAAIHLGCAPKVMELAATDSQQLKAEIRSNDVCDYCTHGVGRCTEPCRGCSSFTGRKLRA